MTKEEIRRKLKLSVRERGNKSDMAYYLLNMYACSAGVSDREAARMVTGVTVSEGWFGWPQKYGYVIFVDGAAGDRQYAIEAAAVKRGEFTAFEVQ